MDEAQLGNGAPAEKGVDALNDQRRLVLQLDGQRPRGDPDDQRASAFPLCEPSNPLRLAAQSQCEPTIRGHSAWRRAVVKPRLPVSGAVKGAINSAETAPSHPPKSLCRPHAGRSD